MKRRQFFTMLASLPIVGRFLPKTTAEIDPVTFAEIRRSMDFLRTLHSQHETACAYWTLIDAGCDEGGVKFQLNLPADYNPPRVQVHEGDTVCATFERLASLP